MEELIVGPITANDPNCCITTFEQNDSDPNVLDTWAEWLEMLRLLHRKSETGLTASEASARESVDVGRMF